MATLSVVQFSPRKTNVLQQSKYTNSNDESPKHDILITNTARKRPRTSKDPKPTNPPPSAVARRNARERNRVKQVNNGFANLRQHIPNFIAAAYESNVGRGGNKKLSKVETLRMAVEYIRSLERLLSLSDEEASSISSRMSSSENQSLYTASPPLSTKTSLSYTFSSSAEDDDISISSETPPPQHYIRINGANNTYHLIPANVYEDSENLEPLVVDESILNDPELVNGDLSLGGIHDLSLLNANHSFPVDMYKEDPLSPESFEKSDIQSYMMNVHQAAVEDTKDGLLSIKLQPPIKQEKVDELGELKESHINQILWWESQQQKES